MADAEAVASSVPGRVVCSHNEWDLLEEVIVGIVEDAVLPEWDVINRVTVAAGEWDPLCARMVGGKGMPYTAEQIAGGQRALANLVRLLESEGVRVRRPDRLDFRRGFATPMWSVASGFSAANPRDVLLVVGDQIIEAPMADRSRYFETWPYRSLLKEYFDSGARWVAAPRPQLLDELYRADFVLAEHGETPDFILTDFEPTFDAAEFARCGFDLFTQRSHVTNDAGIEWLGRHLGPAYRIHVLESRDPHAIHLDSTFVPLADGKALINPEYLDVDRLPAVLRNWDLLVAPPGVYGPEVSRGLLSEWIHLNVLSLDERRVIVEASQEPLIRALKAWGFIPIPCEFAEYYPFVGSFHCATLDIRRRPPAGAG